MLFGLQRVAMFLTAFSTCFESLYGLPWILDVEEGKQWWP
jgi:hypothetical protein